MKNWFLLLRFRSPITYRFLCVLISTVLVVGVFFAIPETEFTRAIGVTGLQHRAQAGRHALFWETRAHFHPDVQVERRVLYGYLESIDNSGAVRVSYPEHDQYVSSQFSLADLRIVDMKAAADLVAKRRRTAATMDVYGKDVVIFFDKKPFNIEFIENGVAEPDPDPDTNIVDLLFATYYWRLFDGKSGLSSAQ